MKVLTVHYERLQGLANFCNAKVGIVIQLEEGESEDEAFERARTFVHAKIKLIYGMDNEVY